MRKTVIGALSFFIILHFIYLFTASLIVNEYNEPTKYIVLFKIILFTIGIIFFIKLFKLKITPTTFDIINKQNFILIVSCFILAVIMQMIVINIENYIFDIQTDPESKKQTLDLIITNKLAIISPLLLSPILEELVFRKVIFSV